MLHLLVLNLPQPKRVSILSFAQVREEATPEFVPTLLADQRILPLASDRIESIMDAPVVAGAVVALVVLAGLKGVAHAQDGWAALAAPGAHAIMRHAIAPGTGDPDGFRLGDCATQRNLDEAGRRQAVAIGEAVDAAGVRVTRVLTSQWCRTAETARLLEVAPVTEEPSLNSFFGDRTDEPAQMARLRQVLAAVGEDEKLVLITHQVNITALTGVNPASGEAIVFTIGAEGAPRIVARIRIDAPN